MKNPKLMVIGHAQHGKDSVCTILRDKYGLSFVSSSFFVMERAVRPYLEKVYRITYDTADACYTDRVNHRDKWHNAIADFNKDDPARLGRELYAEYDVYCGIRSALEFNALKEEKAFDVAIWVDAGLRVEPEPFTSNKLTADYADYILNNNGDEIHLVDEVDRVMKFIQVTFPLKG
jgi:hypothetical protein